MTEQTRLWPSLSVSESPERSNAAYSSLCAYWGSLGGMTTSERYGPAWFRLLALKRHGRISADDLAQHYQDLLDTYMRREYPEQGGR